jgi:phosphatidylserine decarboxylase
MKGAEYDNAKSVSEIETFIKTHNLNKDEILLPLKDFKNFNEFFYRELKPSARSLSFLSCSSSRSPSNILLVVCYLGPNISIFLL